MDKFNVVSANRVNKEGQEFDYFLCVLQNSNGTILSQPARITVKEMNQALRQAFIDPDKLNGRDLIKVARSASISGDIQVKSKGDTFTPTSTEQTVFVDGVQLAPEEIDLNATYRVHQDGCYINRELPFDVIIDEELGDALYEKAPLAETYIAPKATVETEVEGTKAKASNKATAKA